MDDAIAALLDVLEQSRLEYVVIGAHAVNAWLGPRFTADVDVTLQAGPEGIERLKDVLGKRGYRVTREHGADLPSGPDFVRFACEREDLTLEVQTAKTEFQRESLRRSAASGSAPRIASTCRVSPWDVSDRLGVLRDVAQRRG